FDRQPLDVSDAIAIALKGGEGGLHALLRGGDLLPARLHLGVRFDDFAGHTIESSDLAKLRLLHARLRLAAGGPISETEVADLPESAGDRVEGVVEILDVAPPPT